MLCIRLAISQHKSHLQTNNRWSSIKLDNAFEEDYWYNQSHQGIRPSNGDDASLQAVWTEETSGALEHETSLSDFDVSVMFCNIHGLEAKPDRCVVNRNAAYASQELKVCERVPRQWKVCLWNWSEREHKRCSRSLPRLSREFLRRNLRLILTTLTSQFTPPPPYHQHEKMHPSPSVPLKIPGGPIYIKIISK